MNYNDIANEKDSAKEVSRNTYWPPRILKRIYPGIRRGYGVFYFFVTMLYEF
jgi:hypothetical protein